MISNKKIHKIILDCYQELYENSTPKGNYKEMFDNAELNERGEKIIPFDDYELDRETYQNIVNKYINKHKMDKYSQGTFNFYMYLGSGPKFKKIKEDE